MSSLQTVAIFLAALVVGFQEGAVGNMETIALYLTALAVILLIAYDRSILRELCESRRWRKKWQRKQTKNRRYAGS